jgi:hypothetical protein
MTDGIIQKTFNKYLQDLDFMSAIRVENIRDLEQELIKEIKKRIQDLDSESYECKEKFGRGYFRLTWIQRYYISLDLKTLIGD